LGTEALGGATEMDSNAGGATVRAAAPETEPNTALMEAEPGFRLVAWPPATVATVASDDVQVALAVMSRVVESL